MNGKIYQMKVKNQITPDLNPEKFKISKEKVNKTLGLNLNEKEIKTLLEKMGHNYKNNTVEIAAWRTDIMHEVDLIEDIAIAYGYDNFIPEIPEISTIGQENPKEIIKKKISEILTNLKLIEISNYHLTNKKNQFTKMGIPEKKEKDFIEVLESKTEFNILRKDLTHYLLKIASENVDSEYPQDIFEIGKTFELKNSEIIEQEKLSITNIPGNFTKLKQILEHLFKMLDLKIELKEPNEQPIHFIQGRTAEIFFNKESIGFLGEIHPKILRNWRIKMPIALLEISLNKILSR
jgi:phenylalanyl-tRNA synthetase beta chain